MGNQPSTQLAGACEEVATQFEDILMSENEPCGSFRYTLSGKEARRLEAGAHRVRHHKSKIVEPNSRLLSISQEECCLDWSDKNQESEADIKLGNRDGHGGKICGNN